jgi:hypothetical protein
MDGWLNTIPVIVLRCQGCGHCWYKHQPEPAQLDEMYASARPLKSALSVSLEPTAGMVSEMKRLLRVTGAIGAGATLLDYGSGYGRWARAAVQAGFKVTAFEPSAARSAQHVGSFELVHSLDVIRGRQFAALHLEQVLEHIPAPMSALAGARAFCDASTVVRVTVPNLLRNPDGARRWATWPFDGQSPHILAPFEHLHGFTPRSLRALIARAGFRSISLARLLRHRASLPFRRLLSIGVPVLGSTCVYLEIEAAEH